MKNLIIVIIVLVVAVGGYFLFVSNNDSVTVENSATENAGITAGETSNSIKEFDVTASDFKYSVNEIKVKRGDTVRINFTNQQGFHDWIIDEFYAATKQLGVGESETLEFVASRAGTFEYYCSVGNHRAMGMKGILTVEE